MALRRFFCTEAMRISMLYTTCKGKCRHKVATNFRTCGRISELWNSMKQPVCQEMQMKCVSFEIPSTSIRYTYTQQTHCVSHQLSLPVLGPVGNRKMRSNRRWGYHLRSNLWKMQSAKSCPSGSELSGGGIWDISERVNKSWQIWNFHIRWLHNHHQFSNFGQNCIYPLVN